MLLRTHERSSALAGAAVLAATCACASQSWARPQVYLNTFDAPLGAEWSGVTTLAGVQGYAGLGQVGNQFGGTMLYNDSGGAVNQGNPGHPPFTPIVASTLTLTGLGAHTTVSLGFLLAIADSWDGSGGFPSGDFFNVCIDGVSVFQESFKNSSAAGGQSFPAPPGSLLAGPTLLGFNAPHGDSAYDMYTVPWLQGISHTSSTLQIEFFASGLGWQGAGDESWGIDNLSILIDDYFVTPGPRPQTGSPTVPLPSGAAMATAGLSAAAGVRRRHGPSSKVKDQA